MNWKKPGILVGMTALVMSTFSTFVSAAVTTNPTLNSAYEYLAQILLPVGWESSIGNIWTAWVISILSVLVLLVILIDITDLVLPFKKFTNYLITIAFTIVAAIMGIVRTITAAGLSIGSMIAGTAGTLAIVMSGVIIAFAVIVLFFGGNKIKDYLKSIKTNRENLEELYKARRSGGKIAAAREQESTGARVVSPR